MIVLSTKYGVYSTWFWHAFVLYQLIFPFSMFGRLYPVQVLV
jgi:hypothetical protein